MQAFESITVGGARKHAGAMAAAGGLVNWIAAIISRWSGECNDNNYVVALRIYLIWHTLGIQRWFPLNLFLDVPPKHFLPDIPSRRRHSYVCSVGLLFGRFCYLKQSVCFPSNMSAESKFSLHFACTLRKKTVVLNYLCVYWSDFKMLRLFWRKI